ncbi:MAG: response regulator [Limisphaerales bacterium]
MRSRLLLIDNDPEISAEFKQELEAEAYEALLSGLGSEGLVRPKAEPFEMVITEFCLPSLSGLGLVGQLHCARPRLPIIPTLAYGTYETAIEATRLGAFDSLPNSFERPESFELVVKAVDCNEPKSIPMETVTLDSPRLRWWAQPNLPRPAQRTWPSLPAIP